MAALAVVLVSNAVDDTGEQLANPDPRITAAKHQAASVVRGATAASADDFETWADWERRFRQKCSQIEILYGDAGASVTVNEFTRAVGGTTFDAPAAAFAASADAAAPTPTKAQVLCTVQ